MKQQIDKLIELAQQYNDYADKHELLNNNNLCGSKLYGSSKNGLYVSVYRCIDNDGGYSRTVDLGFTCLKKIGVSFYSGNIEIPFDFSLEDLEVIYKKASVFLEELLAQDNNRDDEIITENINKLQTEKDAIEERLKQLGGNKND